MLNKAYFRSLLTKLYGTNITELKASTIRLYSATFDKTYYFTIDIDFIIALWNHLELSGYVFGSDFLFYKEPDNYIFYFSTERCAISFIVFHNAYYPFNPLPVPQNLYSIDEVLFLFSANKVSKKSLVSFNDTLQLKKYSILADNKFGIAQEFSLILQKHN